MAIPYGPAAEPLLISHHKAHLKDPRPRAMFMRR
jgi:hypothetical protein